ncbi:MAG: ribbon-helix-helix protein, CopG family [Limisphaerales bacterium]
MKKGGFLSGRKSVPRKTSLVLPPEIIARIRHLAETRGEPVTAIMRQAIRAGLKIP